MFGSDDMSKLATCLTIFVLVLGFILLFVGLALGILIANYG
jgi:hypothetical protein